MFEERTLYIEQVAERLVNLSTVKVVVSKLVYRDSSTGSIPTRQDLFSQAVRLLDRSRLIKIGTRQFSKFYENWQRR